MKNIRQGFTLVELLVVVIIIGILASVSIPYYYKTVETTKADNSVAIGHMLGNAYRMFQLDNPTVSLSGQVTNSCTGACDSTDLTACRLLNCKYVAQQDWGNSDYNYFVGAASCGGGTNTACVRRGSGPPVPSAPYSGWGYDFDASGRCTPIGGAPNCPRF